MLNGIDGFRWCMSTRLLEVACAIYSLCGSREYQRGGELPQPSMLAGSLGLCRSMLHETSNLSHSNITHFRKCARGAKHLGQHRVCQPGRLNWNAHCTTHDCSTQYLGMLTTSKNIERRRLSGYRISPKQFLTESNGRGTGGAGLPQSGTAHSYRGPGRPAISKSHWRGCPQDSKAAVT